MDAAAFEELKKKGQTAVENWIDSQLVGTSVTVVLIGSETLQRPFVLYELKKSHARGNGIMGVYIDQIKDNNGNTTSRCSIYGVEIGKDSSGSPVYFSQYPLYDWKTQDGYNKLGEWIEAAAIKAMK